MASQTVKIFKNAVRPEELPVHVPRAKDIILSAIKWQIALVHMDDVVIV